MSRNYPAVAGQVNGQAPFSAWGFTTYIRNIYALYIQSSTVNNMGIVKITDQLHEQLRLASAAMDRSINAQAEFWIKIGLLAELNPHLPYNELINKLLLDKPDLIRGRSQ